MHRDAHAAEVLRVDDPRAASNPPVRLRRSRYVVRLSDGARNDTDAWLAVQFDDA
jgi:hypothetical protein